MPIIPAIKNRRSIRAYQNIPVETEKIENILRSAMYSPSARHTRGWEFVVVTDQKLIQQLGEFKSGAEHVKQAQAVIAVVSEDNDHWLEDASIVAAHIYLETTNQGLGTCWTHVHGSQTSEGKNGEDFIKNLLNIEPEKRVLCLMPLGYPAEEKESHTYEEYEQEKVKWI